MQRYRHCCRLLLGAVLLGAALPAGAQTFGLERKSDSLCVVTLSTDSTHSEWPLPYPAYRFCTGDVDGDGSADALVGVVKTTRYDRTLGRRIFIFKQKRGKIRPLWMGTRLGGRLVDFCYDDGTVVALEGMGDSLYAVSQYRWDTFGMTYVQSFVRETCYENAYKIFNDYEKKHHPLPDAHADP